VQRVAPPELEHFHYFRPVVGVLLNLPDGPPETGEAWDIVCSPVSARLFVRQQVFDWPSSRAKPWRTCGRSRTLPRATDHVLAATDAQADLGLDRGLLVSRLEGWAGPLWDTARGSMRGPHWPSDALAALAVGRVLRVGLDEMTTALADFRPPPGRMEFLGAVDGVRVHP